jgi:hypothetical protein
MPHTAILLVILDQAAKLHRLYRVDARQSDGNQVGVKGLGASTPFQQLIEDVVAVDYAHTALAILGAGKLNAKYAAYGGGLGRERED